MVKPTNVNMVDEFDLVILICADNSSKNASKINCVNVATKLSSTQKSNQISESVPTSRLHKHGSMRD